MTRLREKKEFKREYIPVIITGIILILLVGALVFMIFYKGNLNLEEVPKDSGHKVDELNVEVDKDKCSTDLIKKLSDEANKIKMSYKEKAIEDGIYDVDDDSGENFYLYDYVWNVTFDNVTDNFYLKITNDYDDTVKTITKDTLVDGKWEFDTIPDDDVVTYTISVISNPDGCKEQTFRKFELKALIFNTWSATPKCKVYKDFKYCNRWIDEDTLTFDEFEYELAKYIKEHPEIKEENPFGVDLPTTTTSTNKTNSKNSTTTTSKKFSSSSSKDNTTNKENNVIVKDNKIIYAIVIILIIIVGVVIVVLLKKKRSK
ncbi:MAG: hypothetical protein J5982_06080 [Bacilli bacterium]|nr:hypothetical protein [Bacilli bacterium]